MIAVGVARPIAHGQAMIRTLMKLTSANVKRGSGPNTSHTTNVASGECKHGRHEPRRDSVGQRLDGRLRALGLLDEPHDLGKHRVAADSRGAEDEAARGIHRAADHLVADALGDGHCLAGEHRLVERRCALSDAAVHGHPLARPNTHEIAGDHV